MDLINAILATLVIIGGILCGRAFIPHVSIFGPRPVDNLARGLVLCALGAFPRIAFWDVMWGGFGLTVSSGITINLLFNTMLIVGIYFILRARWLTIPDEDRGHYNLITAAFYPKNIFPRLRSKE